MQGRHSSWFVATVVVLCGVAIAFSFQRKSVEETNGEAPVDFSYLADSLIWQEENKVHVSDDDPTRSHRQRLGPLVRDQEVSAVGATESQETRLPEPPRMPDQYGGLAEAYQVGPASEVPRVASRVAIPEPRRERAPVSPPRIHRIVDGDTLTSLAVRYWGDASRAGEIFAANRDVLSHPELLPVGKEIRIPRGDAASGTSSRGNPAPRDSSSRTPLRGLSPAEDGVAGGDERPSLIRPAATRTPHGESNEALQPIRRPSRGDSAHEPARLEPSPRTNLRPLP
jgi:phage tail protein X